MISKNKLKLLLRLLITATLCKGDSVIKKFYFTFGENDTSIKKTWEEARIQCRSEDLNLITRNTVNETVLTVNSSDLNVVWLGLIRDSVNDSAWNWINTQTGAAISEDVSQSPDWADGAQSSHCTYLHSDSKWHSKRCVEEHNFYCSVGTDIQYNTTKLSWHDARDYCQDSEGVLATVTDQNKNMFDQTGWIGLFRVGGETWQWETGEAVNYTAWEQKEPVTYDCGAFNVNSQKWQSYQCSEHAQFICFKDNLVVVEENKTWEEAQEHCESLKKKINTTQHKLLTIDTKSEYNYVRERIYGAITEEVWTGLRFLGGQWWWVNGDQVNDEGNLPKCPHMSNHCGVVSKNDDTRWLTRDCTERYNFICYGAIVSDNNAQD